MALLDILTNKEIAVDEAYSVQLHLHRLLNARQGSISHMPDYGMPDMTNIYQNLPDSLHYLTRIIKQVIEKYEPRLSHITVGTAELAEALSVISVEISGMIAQRQLLRFDTLFESDGSANIAAMHQLAESMYV